MEQAIQSVEPEGSGLTLWTPILGLGVTQIIGYGTLLYSHTVTLPLIAKDLGWSASYSFGIFSVALLLAAIAAPVAGRLIDRYGGRAAMAVGSVLAATALLYLSAAQGFWSFATGIVAVEMAAVFVLYEAAFASLTQIRHRGGARRAITQLTLLGGFASTIFWPLTHYLSESYGWREALICFAALHMAVCLPLHRVCLKAAKPVNFLTTVSGHAEEYEQLAGKSRTQAMIWMIIAFSIGGFIAAAATSNWVMGLNALGVSTAMAVTAGALIGPSQVAVRLLEMFFGDRFHPRSTALFSLTLMVLALLSILWLGATMAGAVAFAVFFGMSNGLTSIVRGTLPLALFGGTGYATRMGWVSFGRMVVNSAAPFGFALMTEAVDGRLAFTALAALALVALFCFLRIPTSQKGTQP